MRTIDIMFLVETVGGLTVPYLNSLFGQLFSSGSVYVNWIGNHLSSDRSVGADEAHLQPTAWGTYGLQSSTIRAVLIVWGLSLFLGAADPPPRVVSELSLDSPHISLRRSECELQEHSCQVGPAWTSSPSRLDAGPETECQKEQMA